MKFLSYLRYVPAITEAVRAAEQTITAPGKGAVKLQLVLDLVQAVFEGSDWPKFVPVLTKWVSVIVGALNAAGEFATSNPAQ